MTGQVHLTFSESFRAEKISKTLPIVLTFRATNGPMLAYPLFEEWVEGLKGSEITVRNYSIHIPAKNKLELVLMLGPDVDARDLEQRITNQLIPRIHLATEITEAHVG